MKLLNCAKCGSLFLMDKSEYCEHCVMWYSETYARIRDYLRTKPNRTIWDVHEDLNIPLSDVQQVLRYMQEQEKR